MKQITLNIILILLPLLATAQNDSVEVVRPVASAWEIGVGAAKITDTYLSPLKYDGLEFSLRYERRQSMKFNPNQWTMQLAAEAVVDKTENPMRYASMWYGGLDLSWGMTRRWRLPHNIIFSAGGSTSLDAGCIYSTRNGNNPASAKAAWTINLTGDISWSTQLVNRKLILRYQPTLPVIGAFFAPEYGELYYEISLGNYDGLCHCAWWGNYFKMENRVTADWYLSKTTALRIGYNGNILSTKVNDVVTQMISHCVVIGVSGQWLSLVPSHSLQTDAHIISAIY